ncbi:hypothetical protein LWI28_013551 [Acer negundo]|uniref:Uncharacterized protein n=1 Tax=Acer negundo TaxID=4023 RepID=A0AAD5JTL7_ACENE|nr:hypothetical protein LWI28_013551 [Acer negundo]
MVVMCVIVGNGALMGLEACYSDSGRKVAKEKAKDHQPPYSVVLMRVATALQPHSTRTVANSRDAVLHLTLKCRRRSLRGTVLPIADNINQLGRRVGQLEENMADGDPQNQPEQNMGDRDAPNMNEQ